MSFLMPSLYQPSNNPSEDLKYGTVIDPHKYPDPKKQGRVKLRVPEIHGDANSGIPDEHLPWSQLERPVGFGNGPEQSTFGLPQKGNMMKVRAHGASKYSPLGSGAPYSTPGKITEFSGDGQSGDSGGQSGGASPQAQAADSGGSSGGSSGGQDSQFNQKDHYGHKDPLGNVYHADMKKKTLTIDWTKFSEVIINHPKITFNSKDTNHDRTKGPNEDGSPTSIQGNPFGSGGGSGGSGNGGSSGQSGQSQQNGGQTVKGDVAWNVQGSHTKDIRDKKDETVGQAVTTNHKSTNDHTVQDKVTQNFQKDYGRKVGQNTDVSGGQGRSDTYGDKWAAEAKPSQWPWCYGPDIG
jgi:hypothetical protein